jgi:hypothetical protein
VRRRRVRLRRELEVRRGGGEAIERVCCCLERQWLLWRFRLGFLVESMGIDVWSSCA